MPTSCLDVHSRIHGEWIRRPYGGYSHREACIDRHRGNPGRFIASNCTLPTQRPGVLRGSVMFIGDSLMQYQHQALVAWMGRAGRPLKCHTVARSSVHFSASDDRKELAGSLPALMFVDTYDGREQDCIRPHLTLMSRRLNVLPTTEADIAAVFDPLFSQMGDAHRRVAVLNVGLWYGPKLTEQHLAFIAALGREQRQQRPSREARERAAWRLLDDGVRAFLRVACRRGTAWPRVLWREHLPQHFDGDGWYQSGDERRRRNASSSPSRRCKPLSDAAAQTMHAVAAERAMRAVREARARDPRRCRVGVIPAFWALASRWMDHEGFRSPSRRRMRRRPDCTHFLPCSGSMMHLNQVTLAAIATTESS